MPDFFGFVGSVYLCNDGIQSWGLALRNAQPERRIASDAPEPERKSMAEAEGGNHGGPSWQPPGACLMGRKGQGNVGGDNILTVLVSLLLCEAGHASLNHRQGAVVGARIRGMFLMFACCKRLCRR